MMFLAIFNVLVLCFIIYSSFRSKGSFISKPIGIDLNLSLNAYAAILKDGEFLRAMGNSLIILIGAMTLAAFLATTVAYALGRYKFKSKPFWRIFFMVGMMFPIQLSVVPIFIMMNKAGLIDSYLAPIIILGSNVSIAIFLLTNFFAGLPNDYHEAAIIDGAGEFTIFFRVMLPIARPVILSLGVMNGVGVWNSFFIPLIFLSGEEKIVLPMMMYRYTANLLFNMDKALACSVLTVVPFIILFLIFSKKILESIASGGIKG